MGIATFFSRILGLVREQVFAFFFGASSATDAFNIAFRIPNLLRDLFAEGAMSAALVPTFVKVRKKEGERRGWRIAGLVFRVLFVFVTIISFVGVVFSEPLVRLYASSFLEVSGKFELTVKLTRILFPFFPFVALAAAWMAVLNACGIFFLPAFSSAIFNLVSIVTGVALSLWFRSQGGEAIEGMAYGVVLGGLAQAFVQLPKLYKMGYRFGKKESTDASWSREPALRHMLALMIPGTLGLAATQINILVNSVLATSQGTGAVSWLNYAFRLMQFPIGIFGVSLASATLPAFTQAWVSGQTDQATATLTRSLRRVFAINLPAAAGLGFLGIPIIQLIFEQGSFDHVDTVATAQALAAYALGLAAYSAVKIFVPIFYALDKTRIPVIASVISVLINLGLNLLILPYTGFWGLALATSVTAVLNLVFLWVAMKKELAGRGVAWKSGVLFKPIFSFTVLSVLMGLACFYADQGLQNLLGLGKIEQLIRVGLDVTLGVGFIFIFGRALGFHDEIQVVQNLIKRIFRR